ncbi:MAG: hypothetical protein K2X00_19845 [Nitrospiraceae bacterium]|nr:hypothetical protein [Nitrospiraceae bacterium]
MTASFAIALAVAAIIVLCCSHRAWSIIRAGKLKTSGYQIDWKSSPLLMAFWIVTLIACPAIVLWGFAVHWPKAKDRDDVLYRIYAECAPGVRPHLRYEGPGVQRALIITQDDSKKWHFSFSAMRLPPEVEWQLDGVGDRAEYRLFDFVGSVWIQSEKCRLLGELKSQQRGELAITGLEDKVNLRPGLNSISVEWKFTP